MSMKKAMAYAVEQSSDGAVQCTLHFRNGAVIPGALRMHEKVEDTFMLMAVSTDPNTKEVTIVPGVIDASDVSFFLLTGQAEKKSKLVTPIHN